VFRRRGDASGGAAVAPDCGDADGVSESVPANGAAVAAADHDATVERAGPASGERDGNAADTDPAPSSGAEATLRNVKAGAAAAHADVALAAISDALCGVMLMPPSEMSKLGSCTVSSTLSVRASRGVLPSVGFHTHRPPPPPPAPELEPAADGPPTPAAKSAHVTLVLREGDILGLCKWPAPAASRNVAMAGAAGRFASALPPLPPPPPPLTDGAMPLKELLRTMRGRDDGDGINETASDEEGRSTGATIAAAAAAAAAAVAAGAAVAAQPTPRATTSKDETRG
jgi:hypothetical protein